MPRPFTATLFLVLAGCGDVPLSPKLLPEPPAPSIPDASILPDGEIPDTAPPTDRPLGPLPASDDCIRCAVTNCFDPGAACVGQPDCQLCVADVLMPRCAQDPLWKALLACVCGTDDGGGVCRTTCLDVCEASE